MKRQSRKRLKKKPLQITVGHAKQKSSNRISTTKYNIVTFLPRFLFEQFQQYANIFFLAIVFIQFVPGLSALGSHTTSLPLGLILCIAAAAEIYEDFRRRISDRKMNKQPTYSYAMGQGWKKKDWAKLKMGEIVKVTRNETIPADLVLISSSEPAGMAYIETASLDGESNLKIRQAVTATFSLTSEDHIKNFVNAGAQLTYEPPSGAIYDFAGVISINSLDAKGTQQRRNYPLGLGQLLPRGAKLKNTEWAYGIAVYTGKATKLMMNMTHTPTKRSGVDKITNHIMMVQFGLLGVISVIAAFAGVVWLNYRIDTHWYLPFESPLSYKLERLPLMLLILGQVTLYAGLIPISLYIYLAMARQAQAFFIRNDIEMYHEHNDTKAEVRRSNLSDDLGQVRYVLADKTGTLTKNQMIFKMCSVAGQMYGNEKCDGFDAKELMLDLLKNKHQNAEAINEFLTILATCHTVVPEKGPVKVVYHGSSPDETALVRCAQLLGYEFQTRTPESVIISSNGTNHTYQILHVLEFTSDRKRMGIIVKTPEDTIKLFLKGADTVIVPRLGPSNSRSVIEKTKEHLRNFAVLGYRTLCIAMREISIEEYSAWEPTYHKACCALEGRKEQIEKVAGYIEKDLMLVGATAIEDKLQEGVPETLKQFNEANIRVWVLTGDKLETATNIGMSCSLIRPGMNTFVISKETKEETLETVRSYVHKHLMQTEDDPNLVVVVDGRSLQHLVDEGAPFEFIRLALAASTLICCRCTPKQKASMVRLVKKHIDGVVLGIGDGANDVAMIQAADVGVGITGEEGMQASMAADYSIGQFRYLARLLFVHGALSYYRTSKVVLFSFYKNLCQAFILFMYMIYNGMSDTPIMDHWSVATYNLCQTSWPPLLLGMLDRHALTDTLSKHPSLYRLNENKARLNIKLHLVWSLNALIHAAIIFFLGIGFHSGDVLWSNGRSGALYSMGCTMDFMLVLLINFKAILETDAINPFTIYVAFGSISFFYMVIILYGIGYSILPGEIDSEMAGIGSILFTMPHFYFMVALGLMTCLLYDIVIKVLQRTLFLTIRERVLYLEGLKGDAFDVLYHPFEKFQKTVFRVFESEANVNLSKEPKKPRQKTESGYAFAQDEGNIVNQSNLVRMYDSGKPRSPGSVVESEQSIRIRSLSSLEKLTSARLTLSDSRSEKTKRVTKLSVSSTLATEQPEPKIPSEKHRS